MDIKDTRIQNFIVFIVLFICIILFTSCPGSSCINAVYSFNATFQIVPDYDSIHVGDTIFLTSIIPEQLKDQTTGAMINYTDAKTIGSNLKIGRLENSNPIPIDAVPEFNYFSITGSIYNDKNIPSPNGVQQLSYAESGGSYQIKVGIIAKSRGVYAFGIGNGLSNGRNSIHSCEKATFNMSLSDTVQHIYFYQGWRPDYTLTTYDLQRIYCFKVY